MGRKPHYHDLNDLMNDLDQESLLNDEVDPLDDDDLELLHQANPNAPKPSKTPPPKKRGPKPKPKK